MKKILKSRFVKVWFVRLLLAFIASQITGLGIGYCLAGYFVATFLFDFAIRFLLSLLGMILMVVLTLSFFIGLLTL